MPRNRIPYIAVTGTVSGVATTRRLPIEQGRSGQAIPVSRVADSAFPDALLIGDSAKRSDQRTAQIVFDDWTGGVGQYEYTETEGINTSCDATVDTRYEKSAVLPPLATQIGGTLGTSAWGTHMRGLYLGYAGAKYLTLANSGSIIFASTYASGTWTRLNTLGFAADACQDNGFVWLLSENPALYRSPDGVTWTQITGMPAIAGGTYQAVAAHDNKLYLLSWYQGVATLWYSTNFTAAAAAVTWTAGGTFTTDDSGISGGETPIRLFEWQYPPSPGKPALWCQTTRALWFYDDDAGVWQRWETLTRGTRQYAVPNAVAIWPMNSNLYVIQRESRQFLLEYTGSTVTPLGPNERGGLPAASLTYLQTLDANGHHLVAFASSYPDQNPATLGRVYAMNAQQGWHCLYSVAGAVYGGWVGPDTLCVVGPSGNVYELPFPDEATIPLHAATATKTYAASGTLTTAWTDGGTPYVNKRALWCFSDLRNGDVSGLPTNATLLIEYAVDGAQSWTTLATLTSAGAFPAVSAFTSGGIRFKRIRFRLTFTKGTATSATPNLATFVLHYVRWPKRRYSYTARVDLRDSSPAFVGKARRFFGYSAASLRKWLDTLAQQENDDGTDLPLVSFTYGGYGNSNHPNYRGGVTQADLVISPVEDPDSGIGRYQLTMRDLTPPASG